MSKAAKGQKPPTATAHGGRRKRRTLAIAALLFGAAMVLTAFRMGGALAAGGDGTDDSLASRGDGQAGVTSAAIRSELSQQSAETLRGDSDAIKVPSTTPSDTTAPADSTVPVAAPAKMRHITVQTGETAPWCRMLLSFFLSNEEEMHAIGNEAKAAKNKDFAAAEETERRQQMTIHNIGWGRKYAHSARPAWILEWLASPPQASDLSDDDIIMFADGGDTLYTGTASETIAAEFDAVAPRRRQVDDEGRPLWGGGGGGQSPEEGEAPSIPALLFNAEANCYHQQTFGGSWGPKKGRCLSAYRRFHNRLRKRLLSAAASSSSSASSEAPPLPPANVKHLSTCGGPNGRVSPKFKYLNAGAWIGRVWAVRQVFAAAKARVDADRGLWCDQSVIGGLLLSGRFSEWTMGIDTENRFFLPIYHLDERRDFCPTPPSQLLLNEKATAEEEEALALRREGAAARRRRGGAYFSMNGENDGSFAQRRLPKADAKPRLLRMCHSNHTPALLHFNGKSEKMARFLTHRASWWQTHSLADARGEGVAAAEGRMRGIEQKMWQEQRQAGAAREFWDAGAAEQHKRGGAAGGPRKSAVEEVKDASIVLVGGRDGNNRNVRVQEKCPALALPP